MSKVGRKLGPLRMIIEVVRPARDLFGSARVRLECGHEGPASNGAIYKARCRKCLTSVSSSVNPPPAAHPGPPNPACSSPTPLTRPIDANLSEIDHVVPGRTL